jgi:murein DD-endopeptidase MepM/ murein hydrolase activator NlpD/urea transporter
MRSAPAERRLAFALALGDRGKEVLCAYGLVMFGGSPLSGIVLFAATLARPESALLGLLAVIFAHAVARAAGYARETVASGYYGCNALLVGLALAEAEPLSVRIALLVCGGAALAGVLSAVLGDLLRASGLPILALPFVVVTSLVWHTTLERGDVPFWLAPTAPAVAAAPFLHSVLSGLGAIVLRPTLLGGVLVLAAAALHSRILAVLLLGGGVVGAAVARELGGGEAALVLPAAYNGALTCAALGAAFYVPSRSALWVALAAAALSGWLTAAWMLPYAPLSVPVLAWPFVFVTLSIMRALGLRAPGRAPIRAFLPGRAPEANLAYARTFTKRLKLPGPPRFVLPVRGEWQVSQGVGGALTHRAPWEHALDFEIVDAEGFPFRGAGALLSDYYCFDQPVLAPGTGVVVAVHDGAPDNAPGQQDLMRPWGNAVVLEHAPGLYSVIAHLKRDSITAVVGQRVLAGEPLARCGASGRSPRPHVHFQAQASASLGAPTLEFRMVNYVVHGPDSHFERIGVPAERARVETPEPAPLGFPAGEIELSVDGRRKLTLRREITLLGEQTLVNTERRERLYFVPDATGVLFTALAGRADGLLGTLQQVAPHLPTVDVPRLRFTEELAPEPLLPLPLRMVHQLLGMFGEFASAWVRGEVVRSQGSLVVESECEVRFLGFAVRRRRGRLELDGRGLSTIELRPFAHGAAPLLRASRLPAGTSNLEHIAVQNYGVSRCAVHH